MCFYVEKKKKKKKRLEMGHYVHRQVQEKKRKIYTTPNVVKYIIKCERET